MKPTIGRIVHFKVPEYLKNQIAGNKSEILPAVIVAVCSDTMVNLKVLTDGIHDLWVTSVSQGDEVNQWNFPVIE